MRKQAMFSCVFWWLQNPYKILKRGVSHLALPCTYLLFFSLNKTRPVRHTPSEYLLLNTVLYEQKTRRLALMSPSRWMYLVRAAMRQQCGHHITSSGARQSHDPPALSFVLRLRPATSGLSLMLQKSKKKTKQNSLLFSVLIRESTGDISIFQQKAVWVSSCPGTATCYCHQMSQLKGKRFNLRVNRALNEVVSFPTENCRTSWCFRVT